MKKILFVRAVADLQYWRNVSMPMGILYLASAVRKRFPGKYEIRVIDMHLERATVGKVADMIRDFSPDIVGCSVLSAEHACMDRLADAVKGIDRGITFIIGGPHPTMYCEESLANPNIDIAVRGEGEETFCELLETLEDGSPLDAVAGIAFRRGSQLVVTADRPFIGDLDSIPFPAWDLISLERYSRFGNLPQGSMRAGRMYASLVTSRGCPYQCVYCHSVLGKAFRARSPENVLGEIMELRTKHHVDEFQIIDDIFNFDRKRAARICDGIIARGFRIWLAFPNGLRGDLLDEELLEKLRAAGTYFITFAPETASARMQKVIRKNLDIGKLRAMIEAADKKGIITKCYCMLGFPGETLRDALETVDFVCDSRLCYVVFQSVTPQKSTELFEMVRKECPGFTPELGSSNYFTPGEMYARKVARFSIAGVSTRACMRFYLDPRRIARICSRMRRKELLLVHLYCLVSILLPYMLVTAFRRAARRLKSKFSARKVL